MSPSLLAIPAFDRIVGSMTDTLTVTGEYAYANGMESGWVPWLIKQKTSANKALFLVGGST